jgi:ABC-2 type transport system ATP-binding protein
MNKTDDQILIKAEGLSKFYGPVVAVDSIDFTVRRGEILGFLGPNGAGKTTTMKMLTCFIAPTHGRASIAGHDTLDEPLAVRRSIGYLPEDTPLYPGMSVLEFLTFVGQVREVPAGKLRSRIKETSKICGLEHVLGRPIGHLSKGFRQRVGLAQAMLHNPDILILDEPWTGLDPNQIADVRQLIKELGKDKTVVLSTHILAEVEAVCDRILIIDRGRIVANKLPEELIAEKGRIVYDLTLKAKPARQKELEKLMQDLPGIETVETIAAPENAQAADQLEFNLICRPGSEPGQGAVISRCVENNLEILDLNRNASSLEDIFRDLTVGDRVEIGVQAS